MPHPDDLILDEFTRGINTGIRLQNQKLVQKLVEKNMSSAFIPSESEEMLQDCFRLIVIWSRKIMAS